MINTDKLLIGMIDSNQSNLLMKGFELRKKFFDVKEYQVTSISDWLVDRLKFIYRIIVDAPFNVSGVDANTCMIAVVGYNGNISSIQNTLCIEEGDQVLNLQEKKLSGGRHSLIFWRRWLCFLGVGLLSFLDFRKISVRRNADVICTVLKCILIEKNVRAWFVYYSFQPYNYLKMAYLESKTNADLTVVMGSSYICPNQYMCLKRGSIKLTSRFQNEEIKFYERKGTIHARSIIKFDGISYVSLRRQECKADIGFLPSGCWCRDSEGVRHEDIISIRNDINNNFQSSYWKLEKKYFEVLCDYVNINGYKMKIYLHPFERFLLKEYGIEPPFKKYANDRISIDESDDTDSHSKFGEFYAGVTVFSSSIWQRDTAGYANNCLYDWSREWPLFETDAMGRYKDNFFENENDLIRILDKMMNS